jgi:hypothetical protein
MNYAKPQIHCLASAVAAVQSGGKGDEPATDSVLPYTTISAYESDE